MAERFDFLIGDGDRAGALYQAATGGAAPWETFRHASRGKAAGDLGNLDSIRHRRVVPSWFGVSIRSSWRNWPL